MNQKLKTALEINMQEIVSSLRCCKEEFIDNLVATALVSSAEIQTIERSRGDLEQLLQLMKIIQMKERGWNCLDDFLKSHHLHSLAFNLRQSATEIPAEMFLTAFNKGLQLEKFSYLVAKYYELKYNNRNTLSGEKKNFNDVWIPLHLKREADEVVFDSQTLLEHVMRNTRLKGAFITGLPGVGKTTLIKKMAYDWAKKIDRKMKKKSISSSNEEIELLLVAPIGKLDKQKNFLQAVVSFLLAALHIEDEDTPQTMAMIEGLKSKLLVCLDGLDSYAMWEKFSLEVLKPCEACNALDNCTAIESCAYKMVITSQFFQLHEKPNSIMTLQIMPIQMNSIPEFLSNFDKTFDPRKAVSMPSKNGDRAVIDFPRLIYPICCLANEISGEIPNDLTSLYLSFVRGALVKQIKKGRLMEPIDLRKWKGSNIIKTTAALAFHGCQRQQWTFREAEQKQYNVSASSFLCRYLVYFNGKDGLEIEFLHPSIQEFFAAIHCYHLMEVSDCDSTISVALAISKKNTQVGRFFFGISSLCSKGHKFQDVIDWISKPALSIKFYMLDYIIFISASLIDRTKQDMQQYIEHLLIQIRILKLLIVNAEREILWSTAKPIPLRNLNWEVWEEFGFRYDGNPTNKENSWCINGREPRIADFCRIVGEVGTNIKSEYNSINTCLWFWHGHDFEHMIDQVNYIPATKTLVIKATDNSDCEVNVNVEYSELIEEKSSCVFHYISFSFCKSKLSDLQKITSQLQDATLVSIAKQQTTYKSQLICWAEMKVKRVTSHTALLGNLLHRPLLSFNANE